MVDLQRFCSTVDCSQRCKSTTSTVGKSTAHGLSVHDERRLSINTGHSSRLTCGLVGSCPPPSKSLLRLAYCESGSCWSQLLRVSAPAQLNLQQQQQKQKQQQEGPAKRSMRPFCQRQHPKQHCSVVPRERQRLVLRVDPQPTAGAFLTFPTCTQGIVRVRMMLVGCSVLGVLNNTLRALHSEPEAHRLPGKPQEPPRQTTRVYQAHPNSLTCTPEARCRPHTSACLLTRHGTEARRASQSPSPQPKAASLLILLT
jgi:hypothetical protein